MQLTKQGQSSVRVDVVGTDTRHFAAASAVDVSEPVKSVLDASLAEFKPVEISLDAFNSQYLQRCSLSGRAILGAAKASRLLDTPREEVEQLLFTTLAEGVELGLEVRTSHMRS